MKIPTTSSIKVTEDEFKFNINDSYESLMLMLDMDNAENISFRLLMPDGTDYPLIEATNDMSLYANYFVQGQTVYLIIDKDDEAYALQKGEYKLISSGVDAYSMNVIDFKTLLEIKSFEIVEKTTGVYDVYWEVKDDVSSETPANLKIYVSDEMNNYTGLLIEDIEINGNIVGGFELDLNSIAALTGERYWLYGKLSRNGEAPHRLFNDKALGFNNTKLPESPKAGTIETGNGEVDVVFDAVKDVEISHYLIGVLDDEGAFDFTMPATKIYQTESWDQLSGTIYGLPLNNEYEIGVVSVATYEESGDNKYFYSEPLDVGSIIVATLK